MMMKWLQKATDAVASIQNKNSRVIDDPDEVLGVPDDLGEDDPTDVMIPPAPRMVSPDHTPKLDLIVVPQSAFNALDDNPQKLTDAVTRYVEHMTLRAGMDRYDLPAEALQAVELDHYHRAVRGTGHAAYVETRKGDLPRAMHDLMRGAMALGADGYHKVISDMAEWVALNPDHARRQSAKGEHAAGALVGLDAPFEAINAADPFCELLADWIADLEVLLTVPDAEYEMTLDALADLHDTPQAAPDVEATPEKHGDIARYAHMLSDPLQLGLAHAGGAIKDPLIDLSAGVKMKIKGNDITCWMVTSTGGKRWGVVNKTGAALLDYIENDDGTPPTAGAVLTSVSQDQINVARQMTAQVKAAAAIDLVLARLQREIVVDFVSVRSAGRGKDNLNGASIYVIVNGATEAFTVLVTTEGAKLLEEPTHNILAAATREEIDAHAARASVPVAA